MRNGILMQAFNLFVAIESLNSKPLFGSVATRETRAIVARDLSLAAAGDMVTVRDPTMFLCRTTAAQL